MSAQREVIEDFISSLALSPSNRTNYTFSSLLLGKKLELSDQLNDSRLKITVCELKMKID